MSAFHVKTVTILTETRTKRDSGVYDEEEVQTTVQGRLYRRRPGYNRMEARPAANGANPGITTLVDQLILRLPLGTAISKSQIVIVDGIRYIVHDIRSYPDCLQCDVEQGAAEPQKATVTA